jgi:hypothetical protein
MIEGVDAAVPAPLEYLTLTAAQEIAQHAGRSLTIVSSVSLPVASLVEGVVQAMILNQIRTIALSLALAVGTLAAGVVVGAAQSSGEPPDRQSVEPVKSQDVVLATQPPKPAEKAAAAGGSAAPAPGQGLPAQGQRGAMMQGMGGGGGMGGGRGGMMNAEARNRVLRSSIANHAAIVAARDPNPKTKDTLKKLDEFVAMSFANETPLDDVLKYIKQASTTKTYSGIPIYIDPKGLQEAEKSLNSTIQIDLEGVPLKTTLRLILKQLDLAYCVRDGVLIISSVPGIAEELQEAVAELEANDPPKSGRGLM